LDGDVPRRSGSKQGRRLHGFSFANRLNLLRFHLDLEIAMGQGRGCGKARREKPAPSPTLSESPVGIRPKTNTPTNRHRSDGSPDETKRHGGPLCHRLKSRSFQCTKREGKGGFVTRPLTVRPLDHGTREPFRPSNEPFHSNAPSSSDGPRAIPRTSERHPLPHTPPSPRWSRKTA